MRPKSIENVMNHIGYDKIDGATILEIGCGQGYLVNHFLLFDLFLVYHLENQPVHHFYLNQKNFHIDNNLLYR